MSNDIVVALSGVGLFFGFAGALGLASLTKVFIMINEDGTQSWGPPEGMGNEEWRRRNRTVRKRQKYGLPASYLALALGFFFQLISLIAQHYG